MCDTLRAKRERRGVSAPLLVLLRLLQFGAKALELLKRILDLLL